MSVLTPKNGSGVGFVEVALPVPLRRTFTYKVTANNAARVQIGTRVVVPFGKRMLTGMSSTFSINCRLRRMYRSKK
jgi:Primosomal protein N'' (replication factor Y) - superfamily II helicase